MKIEVEITQGRVGNWKLNWKCIPGVDDTQKACSAGLRLHAHVGTVLPLFVFGLWGGTLQTIGWWFAARQSKCALFRKLAMLLLCNNRWAEDAVMPAE